MKQMEGKPSAIENSTEVRAQGDLRGILWLGD